MRFNLNKTYKHYIIILICIAFSTDKTAAQIVKGADVGWLSYFENTLGITYLNDQDEEQDALEILKEHGMNAIRLRAFVNPTEENIGEVNTEGVVKNALRAKNLGLDVMITIHYSDTWADPGKQYKPEAWENLSFTELQQAVYDYTYQFIDALLTAGVTPKWVQVGNETDPGFIWEEGRLSSSNNFANMANYVALSNKGYDAIKDRSPTTKVITHIADGIATDFLVDFFNAFYAQGGKNDIIGVSYYPRWHGGTINNLVNNLNLLSNQFNKDVMICEIGALETLPAFNYNMLVDAINLMKAIPDNRGLGVFYWEPIAHTSINGYEQGLAKPVANEKYKFSWVLDAFKENAENCTPTSIVPQVKINDDDFKQISDIVGRIGNTIKLNIETTNSGTWSWKGPNDFTASTQGIELPNIQKEDAGIYEVTFIPKEGCQASIAFTIDVYEVGEIVIGNSGFESGELSPWLGSGNYGIDSDLVSSGTYSGWFGGGNSELYQILNGLLPNTTYQFSSYIRNASGDNGVVTLGVRNFGAATETTEVNMTGNFGNDFELATVNFTTGETNTSAEIFVSTSKNNTWGKIDDAKVIPLSSLSINYFKSDAFRMYPNPTENFITIKFLSLLKDKKITIYNVTGKVVQEQKVVENTKSVRLPLLNLSDGIYFLQVKSESSITTKKLIVK